MVPESLNSELRLRGFKPQLSICCLLGFGRDSLSLHAFVIKFKSSGFLREVRNDLSEIVQLLKSESGRW